MEKMSEFYKIPIISIDNVFKDLNSEGKFKKDMQLVLDY